VSCGVVDSEFVTHPPDELLGFQRIGSFDPEPEKLADPDRLRLREMRLDQVPMDYVPFWVLCGGLVGDYDFDHENLVGLRDSAQLVIGI
jgi:hypothetical protein